MVLSTHGSRTECGLTEVDIYDVNEVKVEDVECLGVTGSPIPNNDWLHRLTDTYTHTTQEEHMWYCNLPNTNEEKVTIEFSFRVRDRVGGIRIWNYNKSALDARIGVKGVDVYLDQSLIYHGQIK